MLHMREGALHCVKGDEACRKLLLPLCQNSRDLCGTLVKHPVGYLREYQTVEYILITNAMVPLSEHLFATGYPKHAQNLPQHYATGVPLGYQEQGQDQCRKRHGNDMA